MIDFLFSVASDLTAEIVAAVIFIAFTVLKWRRIKRYWRAMRFLFRMLRSGFTNFYTSRKEYYTGRSEKTLDDYILKCRRRFVYVGLYLSGGTETAKIDNAISVLLARGAEIDLVLLDEHLEPYAVAFLERHLGIAAGTLVPRLSAAKTHFGALRQSLAANHQQHFHIRTHSEPVTCSVMFLDYEDADGCLLVDTKIYGAGRDHSYGMEFRPTDDPSALGSQFAASFQRIIAMAQP